MLKKIWRLFLGLVVCIGSACVTPTHASSAESVVLTHIQAAGTAGAKDEFIALHNNSAVEVEVTNWCVANKAGVSFTCFINSQDTATLKTRYYLPAYGDAVVASKEHAAQSIFPNESFPITYTVTNQSSGSIVGSADTITLVNNTKEVVDQKSWTSPLSTGKVWQRAVLFTNPLIYAQASEVSDWSMGSMGESIVSSLEVTVEEIVPPVDPPVDTPADPNESEPTTPPAALLPPIITELLANPAGADAGNEFIELYNPNEQGAISLEGFRLRIGLDTPKWITLPAELSIAPLQYFAIYNDIVVFTLPNSASGVQIFKGEEPMGERIDYMSPKDNHSWALVDGAWQYLAVATPSDQNRVTLGLTLPKTADPKSTEPKPCAANQFRNPETGRCKLLAAATTGPAPCKVDQERNPETGRCRALASTKAAPTPCKAGQERNPETNRCRNIVKMSKADYGVKGAQTQASNQPSWYTIATIGAIVAGIMAYAIWEWRHELNIAWRRARQLFAKQQP